MVVVSIGSTLNRLGGVAEAIGVCCETLYGIPQVQVLDTNIGVRL